jgi:putative oxidoreductase
MNTAQRLEHWGDTHHPRWLDFIRIALGIYLMIKGVQFLTNMSELVSAVGTTISSDSFALIMVSHVVVFAHIVGGLMIAVGLFTRFACILQIPILIGALLFLRSNEGALAPYSQWIVTVITLLLLCLFAIVGNGPWSVEKYFDEKPVERKVV